MLLRLQISKELDQRVTDFASTCTYEQPHSRTATPTLLLSAPWLNVLPSAPWVSAHAPREGVELDHALARRLRLPVGAGRHYVYVDCYLYLTPPPAPTLRTLNPLIATKLPYPYQVAQAQPWLLSH